MRKLAWLTSLAASLVLAVSATAAPPEHTPWITVAETDIIPAAPTGPCAYAIRVDVVGKVRAAMSCFTAALEALAEAHGTATQA